jgi:hypothetical protein
MRDQRPAPVPLAAVVAVRGAGGSVATEAAPPEHVVAVGKKSLKESRWTGAAFVRRPAAGEALRAAAVTGVTEAGWATQVRRVGDPMARHSGMRTQLPLPPLVRSLAEIQQSTTGAGAGTATAARAEFEMTGVWARAHAYEPPPATVAAMVTATSRSPTRPKALRRA